jgi:hypothetical protein
MTNDHPVDRLLLHHDHGSIPDVRVKLLADTKRNMEGVEVPADVPAKPMIQVQVTKQYSDWCQLMIRQLHIPQCKAVWFGVQGLTAALASSSHPTETSYQ